MDKSIIKNITESILFVSGDTVLISDLARLFELSEEQMEEIALEMIEERENSQSGLLIRQIDEGIQFCTNRMYSKYVEELLSPKKTYTLSQAAVETLSIIAYKQPVTKSEIEAIRGIRCDYTVSALIDRGLIFVSGKKDVLGRPNLYSTSEEFLRHFGMKDLSELPKLKEAE
ncbi:MAG: SMC-Scp complex subunit ScpB [Eubacteriales bacterium]